MKVYKISYYAFCGLLLGLTATLLISMSIWLEMRVHNRYVVVGFALMGLIYGVFAKRLNISAIIFSEVLLFLLIFWLNKPNLIFFNIKESYLDFLSIGQIRYGFLTILTIVNIIVLFVSFGKYKP
ncbi:MULTISPECIES: hypothetical protein [unclassified Campylobacter]|uniref:hypothetical protein n=1 Tax=unclassified Campylobacter TaxID=2593542 RepID=UPI001452651E|nr:MULTISPECIES: hypothetical protein [unclassified Campylobacter]QCD53144.1 putative membrane protein [Campylobacter sp. RM16192]